ncbi:MAG: XdhC family protein [Bacillota bacterium]
MKAIYEALRRTPGPAALATVLRVEGSAYRRAGAQMLIPAGGDPVGVISGGCLEADVIEQARDVLAGRGNQLLSYDLRSEDESLWGLNLGCNGLVQVLVERVEPAIFTPLAAEWAAGRSCASVAVVQPGPYLGRRLLLTRDGATYSNIDEPHLEAAALAAISGSAQPRWIESAGTALFVMEHRPPPVLWVVGAGRDAQPVVELAARMGWRVQVVDRRRSYADPSRFPTADAVRCIAPEELAAEAGEGAFAVFMHHHFDHDRAYLQAMLATGARYLGVLGPRTRTLRLLGTDRLPANVYGPVGLDLGGEGPEAVALSIMAEVQAVCHDRSGLHLRGPAICESRVEG